MAETKKKPERHLNDAQRLAWLRLIRSESIGPTTFRALVNQFGGAEAAIEALPALARRGGRAQGIQLFAVAEAEAELERAAHLGAHLVTFGEFGYPPALAQVENPPPLIYVKGRRELAERPVVAIVGARNGSAAGRKIARQIAQALGVEGFVVASGLARGIDTAAHIASLDHGTMAVVAGGLDVVYPPENAELQQRIGEQGLLISERAPGLTPRAKDFPRRNRLISGVAMGVLVVEAAERSGSLITARLAGEQGREVFAVPGSPLDPRAAGTNRLLKQGATLTTSADDILETLAPILGRAANGAGAELSSCDQPETPRPFPRPLPGPLPDIAQSERDEVLAALGPSPVDADEIIRVTGLEARRVHIILLELDLAGRLQRHSMQLVSLVEL